MRYYLAFAFSETALYQIAFKHVSRSSDLYLQRGIREPKWTFCNGWQFLE